MKRKLYPHLPLCLIIIFFITNFSVFTSCKKDKNSSLNVSENKSLTPSDTIAELTRLLEKNPDNADYLLKRSYQYYRINKMTNAFDDINRAMLIEPKNEAFYHMRGFYYYSLKKDDEALKDFEKSAYLSSANPETYYQIGNIYVLKKQPEKSIKFYDQAIKLDAKDPQYDFAKAFAFKEMKQTQKAIVANFVALSKDSSFVKSLNLMFDIYLNDLDDIDKASHFNILLVKKYPKNSLGHFNLGVLFFKKYQKIINKQENSAQNFLKQAIAAYTEAIKFQPDFSKAYYQRGYVYMELNQLEKASNDFDKTVQIDDKNAEAYFMLGSINEAFGEKDKAKNYYKKASELNTNLIEAKTALQQLK